MFVKRKAFGWKFQDEADEGGEGTGGEGGKVAFDPSSPEAKAAIRAAIDAEVGGLKKKNAELIEKLKAAPKIDQAQLDNLLKLQKTVEANEEMKLLSEGKLDEVLTRRNEAWKRDTEAQIAARDGKLQEYENTIKSKDERLRQLLIDHEVRSAYNELDYEPAALEDILLQARTMFVMEENGTVVPRDKDGVLRMGKDGKTPLKPKEWLEGLVEKKPYLKRPSVGSGANPARTGGTKGFDPSKASAVELIAEGLKSRKLFGTA